MKSILIKHDKVTEIYQWCEENLGPENKRWWTTKARAHWDDVSVRHVYDTVFYFDVTEDEEINLTYVMLKWGWT